MSTNCVLIELLLTVLVREIEMKKALKNLFFYDKVLGSPCMKK